MQLQRLAVEPGYGVVVADADGVMPIAACWPYSMASLAASRALVDSSSSR